MKKYLYLIRLFIASSTLCMTSTVPNTPESDFYNSLIMPWAGGVKYPEMDCYRSSSLTKKYKLWGLIGIIEESTVEHVCVEVAPGEWLVQDKDGYILLRSR